MAKSKAASVTLEAITEAVNILHTLSQIDHDEQWVTNSVHLANLDRMAQALGFPNALAIHEQVEGDRQHEEDRHRDMGW